MLPRPEIILLQMREEVLNKISIHNMLDSFSQIHPYFSTMLEGKRVLSVCGMLCLKFLDTKVWISTVTKGRQPGQQFPVPLFGGGEGGNKITMTTAVTNHTAAISGMAASAGIAWLHKVHLWSRYFSLTSAWTFYNPILFCILCFQSDIDTVISLYETEWKRQKKEESRKKLAYFFILEILIKAHYLTT